MDFYRILGVNRDASQQEVKDAWRREALKNHPDRLQHASDSERAEAARRFKEAKEAYEVLCDEGKRALYNTSGRSAVYAAQRQGRTSSYRSDFTPRARSGWSNFKYQQQRYNRHGSAFNFFRGFTTGMGRADAYFHAGFAGILVIGVVLVAPMADSLWDRMNSGKLFKHMKPADADKAPRILKEQPQNESERLRAQGVPREVIAGMRHINAHGFSRQPIASGTSSSLDEDSATPDAHEPVEMAAGEMAHEQIDKSEDPSDSKSGVPARIDEAVRPLSASSMQTGQSTAADVAPLTNKEAAIQTLDNEGDPAKAGELPVQVE